MLSQSMAPAMATMMTVDTIGCWEPHVWIWDGAMRNQWITWAACSVMLYMLVHA